MTYGDFDLGGSVLLCHYRGVMTGWFISGHPGAQPSH